MSILEGSTHAFQEDPRNADINIYINGDLFHRNEAKISVFDSGFLLGDGVWEGIRLHKGRLAFGEAHLSRLYEGAAAIDLDIGMEASKLESAIYKTLAANEMTTGVHIRLIVSRGLKITPYQHPKANVGGPTVVIIPEYKSLSETARETPINLQTVHVRRGSPDTQDPKWNSLSKLNCITACIQADKAGADEALMLDPHGFVSTCNSTNFFIVRKGEVWTSTGAYCLNGVTRENIIKLCVDHGIPVFEKDFSLVEVYGSDEAFVTGTFAGVIPVGTVDGRTVGNGQPETMTGKLQELYDRLVEEECAS